MRAQKGWLAVVAVAAGAVCTPRSAADDSVLFAVTHERVLVIDPADASIAEDLGAHGLPTTVRGEQVFGAFSLAYDPASDRLFGLHYSYVAASDSFDQSLVEYDTQTGVASVVHVLGNSGVVGYFETIAWVDTSGSLVVSRSPDAFSGSVTSQLLEMDLQGGLTLLTDNGRDNDYGVFDPTRGVLYVIDPNGLSLLSSTDLTTGVLTDLGWLPNGLSDLAYCAATDRVYSYDIVGGALVRIDPDDNGSISFEVPGIVPSQGTIQGLAFASGAPDCPPDLNEDGIVDSGDIRFFIALFFAGDPASDLNGDGLVDNGDIQVFVVLFGAGC